MKKYNIVLMVSDDHGRETLGCYGNPVAKTPNLDRLASEGTMFQNAFCTSPSCAASRSVILTGTHNHTNGTYGHTHHYHHFSAFNWVKTLPALLAEAGYRTGRVGKKHFAPESIYPFDFGGEEREFDRDDVAASESCREFIEADDPFFLYWCSFNPHRDGRTIDSHPCKPNSFGNPVEPFEGDVEETFTDEEVIVPPFLTDNPEARAELAQYYQSIARLDRGVGRLMQVLKDAGKYDDTLIIYLSDNGAAFPASKTTLYDPGMRLPFIVRSPEQARRGVSTDALASWVDITPTVLDAAGVVPEGVSFQGRSILPVLDQESPEDWREEIYGSHSFHELTNYYPMRIIRSKKYKFIWNIAHPLDFSFAEDLWNSATWEVVKRDKPEYFGVRKVDAYIKRPKFELYDLENDPDEIDNLAGKTEYAEMVEAYCEKLKAFQKETKDPWLHKWEYE
ncbi:sulfatase family protein [Pelagicoccus mobilis]|uniref:Sulfatase n=1 Tax=Pelagicoccus mobilis TaxID=415221 RepID=A0A934RTE4_9BACT|nr:sulfatase [Pelagicoccus mobilis]MBK1876103.1 sulfatase [Pelagicoccus mobilis]